MNFAVSRDTNSQARSRYRIRFLSDGNFETTPPTSILKSKNQRSLRAEVMEEIMVD